MPRNIVRYPSGDPVGMFGAIADAVDELKAEADRINTSGGQCIETITCETLNKILENARKSTKFLKTIKFLQEEQCLADELAKLASATYNAWTGSQSATQQNLTKIAGELGSLAQRLRSEARDKAA